MDRDFGAEVLCEFDGESAVSGRTSRSTVEFGGYSGIGGRFSACPKFRGSVGQVADGRGGRSCRLKRVRALDVQGEAHEGPLSLHLLEAPEAESSKAHHFLDPADRRLIWKGHLSRLGFRCPE